MQMKRLATAEHVRRLAPSDHRDGGFGGHPAYTPAMDITGARWGLDGAEAILKLRAIRSNGDFDEYWHYHLTQRTPPSPRLTLRRALRPAPGMTVPPEEPHPFDSAARPCPRASGGACDAQAREMSVPSCSRAALWCGARGSLRG